MSVNGDAGWTAAAHAHWRPSLPLPGDQRPTQLGTREAHQITLYFNNTRVGGGGQEEGSGERWGDGRHLREDLRGNLRGDKAE